MVHRTHQGNNATLEVIFVPDWPEGTKFRDYDRHVSTPTECEVSVEVPGFPIIFFRYNLFERLSPEQIMANLWQLYKSLIETLEIAAQHLEKGFW